MKVIRLTLLFLVLLSCDADRVFEKNISLPERTWVVDQPVTWDFVIEDATRPYNIYFNIRNSLEFPYARLFVQYTLADSAGTSLLQKLSSHYLFDQKTGKPLGSSAIGDVFDHRFLILSNYTFAHPGQYRLTLEQYNREDALQGVVAAGIRVERAAIK
jgi:gliding motility-associated lipoprotein GldH